jgi:hypothetical protein
VDDLAERLLPLLIDAIKRKLSDFFEPDEPNCAEIN